MSSFLNDFIPRMMMHREENDEQQRRRRDTAGQSSGHKKWRKGYILFGQESFLVSFSFKKKVISLSMAVSLLSAMKLGFSLSQSSGSEGKRVTERKTD